MVQHLTPLGEQSITDPQPQILMNIWTKWQYVLDSCSNTLVAICSTIIEKYQTHISLLCSGEQHRGQDPVERHHGGLVLHDPRHLRCEDYIDISQLETNNLSTGDCSFSWPSFRSGLFRSKLWFVFYLHSGLLHHHHHRQPGLLSPQLHYL